jgi:hypothetical protein
LSPEHRAQSNVRGARIHAVWLLREQFAHGIRARENDPRFAHHAYREYVAKALMRAAKEPEGVKSVVAPLHE